MLRGPFRSYVSRHLGLEGCVLHLCGMMVAVDAGLYWRAVADSANLAPASLIPQIMRSLPGLVARTPLLRRRAFYQGMMFAGFNVFWTASPLLLSMNSLDHRRIALFTLAGAAGALSAPIAGRLADRGLTRSVTGCALVSAVIAFAIAIEAGRSRSLTLLVIRGVTPR